VRKYATATEGSPFDGIFMNYVNPITGGHVMQTIGASMQLLRRVRKPRRIGIPEASSIKSRKAAVTRSSPASASSGGSGTFFCVPSWAWHEHGNASDGEDACLFSFNDLPVIEGLGLYREEAFGDNAGHQAVAA